jgi:pteridine reductase
MKLDLTGQIALVTGAAHRVGRAIALELAAAGAHIVVHYHSATPEQVSETLAAIQAKGVQAHAVQADLSQPEAIGQLFEAVQAHFGALHILVNSASAFQRRGLMDVSLEDWQFTLAVNLTAPFLCTQAAARMMQANDPVGGVIVNISDRGADTPWLDYAHHGISKAGLLALSQTSALSLGPAIRVNTVIPGPVMKPAGRPMTDEGWAAIGEETVLQKTGDAEDVARAVAYLASESFITGAVIHVNGGEHLR